ncbi:MAG: invasin domain 3-containing protein [Isosphaeraceae bacterium]
MFGRRDLPGGDAVRKKVRRNQARALHPWSLGFELLEDRTLLATLQFTGSLGELSTLDSVAATANYLPDVNQASTEKFTHSDGTAWSNVTLTTSAYGVGGVNLDVDSGAGVAENGRASVAVQGGLADSSGNIGSSVQVAIEPSDSSEQIGDPVTVQLRFSFEVGGFDYNNATADFSYSATYTYKGNTQTLAFANELGGTGIGPEVGDTATGTLNAKIGDTFTISFSENLAGQTVAPFLGDGINNVSWGVDTSLSASIEAPDIVLDSVMTTDSREAIVSYDVNTPNLAGPLYIQIYRSDKSTYDSNDPNNVAVGDPYQIELQPGHYTTNTEDEPPIDLFIPGRAKQPLAPDPSRPYVLAVIEDGDGNLPTNLTIDESQAHFKIWVIADVTYGFSLTGEPPAWAQQIATALDTPRGAGGAGYNSALIKKWSSGLTTGPGEAVEGGDALCQQVAEQAAAIEGELGKNDVIDVQLIGHSRGAAVIGVAMQELVENTPATSPLGEGYYKLTFLDPHPANAATAGDVRIQLPIPKFNAFAVFWYFIRSALYNDPSVVVSSRVNAVEDFYEQNSNGSIAPANFKNEPEEEYFNLLGDPSEIQIEDPANTIAEDYDLSPLGLGHSDVWRWYIGHVVPGLGTGQAPPYPASPSASAPPPNTVSLDQILQSQYVPNQNEAATLSQNLTSAQTDLSQGNYGQANSELQAFVSAIQAAPPADFSANSAPLLESIGETMIADLGATDVSNINTTTVQGPDSTAQAQAGDSANNQQVSGSITTGPDFSGTANFSVGNYTQNPDSNPTGQVSQAAFDVQTTGIDPTASATAGVTFTAQVPTQQLDNAVLSYYGDDGQWQTVADYNGTSWVQIGSSGDTPIQEQNSPVGGTNMSTISLPVQFDNNTAPAVGDLGGTVFVLSVPTPISLSPLPGGTVGAAYNQTITASGGTGDKTLIVSDLNGAIPGLSIPPGGTNTLAITGAPTAAGMVSFTVLATDSVGIPYSQNYTLAVTTDDPTRSRISITPTSIVAGATARVTLTAITTSGVMATTGGLSVAFGLGNGSAGGTFGAVTDNGDGTYTAVFTGTTAGTNTITATINGQPVTTTAPSVTVTPGQVDLTQSTVSASAPALPVGGTTTVTLLARDAYGNEETTGGLTVSFGLDSPVGTFSQVIDNGNGTYSATFTATSPGTADFSATINGQPIAALPPTGITVVALSLANSTVTVAPATIPGDGTATVTFTAIDAGGSQETQGGWTVAFAVGPGTGSGTFGPVTDNGNGTYTATFSAQSVGSNTISATVDGFAITSVAAPITITDYVQVTSDPTDQVANVSGSVSFTASAAGIPTPTVQWQVSTDGGNTFTNLAGETFTTLSFTASESQNGDEYRAVFTNSSGSATTTAATLTVNTKPGGLVISDSGAFPHFNLALPTSVDTDQVGQILPLGTGNVLVADYQGAGAVYLFNGETGALISTLTGAYSATALTNGNFVAIGPGSATWGSGITGVSGTVSAANSLVAGSGTGPTTPTVTPLADGNYVLDFVGWNDDRGAVAWGNGTTGTSGTVSDANSLLGTAVGDWVGGNSEQPVVALPDGNYVVVSPFWNNDEGAVTWGSGTAGVSGTISDANSMIGFDDQYAQVSVTVLTNGNYVAADSQADGAAGVVTWGSGTAGAIGVISADNSLFGMTGGPDGDDTLGNSIAPLANGNYVVSGEGTATWVNGTTGLVGTVSAENSLVGGGSAISTVTALTDGDYVVDNSDWNDFGAVTWGNGATGTVGTVSAANSLVGSNLGDFVGGEGGTDIPVTALTNGNYVVSSPEWNNLEGAVTLGNGTTGTVGTVSAMNSLVGSTPFGGQNPTGDQVGSGGVTALTNGNYVVASPDWSGQLGAVTWGNGTTGTVGTVSLANSLVGSSPADYVGGNTGTGLVTALDNGDYVVASPQWNNYLGAVTWGNGTTGVTGIVSAANSLVGSTSYDQVGSGKITALPSGNYVVLSPFWQDSGGGEVGAATWGDGMTGITGTISTANSIIGVGYYYSVLTVLPNGNYVAGSTWVDGATGLTLDGQNTPDAQNSLGGGAVPLLSGGSFVCGSGYDISVAITDPNDLTYALGQGQTITVTPAFITNALDAGTNVTLQANDDITVTSPIVEAPTGSAGSLTLEAGRSVVLDASIDTAGGNLLLVANDSVADGVINSQRDPGDADITMAPGATVTTGAGMLSIDLENSTDKTNNSSGAVTLLGVSTGATTLSSTSALGISINGTTAGDGMMAGTYTQVEVTGPINLDGAPLTVTANKPVAAGATYTIVQASGGVSGTFAGLPQGAVVMASNGDQFTISYTGDGGTAVVLTAKGATGPPPAVSSISPPAGLAAGSTQVTITGSNLANAIAVDFGVTPVTSFVSDTATQIIVMSPAGTGTVDVTVETASGTSGASSTDKFGFVAALAQLAFSAATLTVNENAGAAVFTVVRTGGYEGAVSVSAATAGGTAVAGVNYTPVNEVLNFAAGQNSQSVTIPVKDNAAQTKDLTVNIVLSNPGVLASLGSSSTTVLTIHHVAQSAAPLVTVKGVRLVKNSKGQVSEVVITFSGGVNASESQSLSTYALTAAGKGGSFTAKNAKPINLRSAVYAGASDEVMLTPASPFGLTKAVQLIVYGTGPRALHDSEGRPIEGNNNGDAVAILTRSGATIDAVAPAAGLVDLLLSNGSLTNLVRQRRT